MVGVVMVKRVLEQKIAELQIRVAQLEGENRGLERQKEVMFRKWMAEAEARQKAERAAGRAARARELRQKGRVTS